jgi:hypothetical protein
MNLKLKIAGHDGNAGVDEGQIAVIWDNQGAIEMELQAMKVAGEWKKYGWENFQDALHGLQDVSLFWKKVRARGRCTVIEGNTRVT